MLDRSLCTLFLSGRSACGCLQLEVSEFEAWIYTSLHVLQGLTSIALYGLGNIRDERLNRMFQVLIFVLFQNCLAA